MRPLKICIGASAGGHMNQLLRLLDNAAEWPFQPSVFITTKPELEKKLREKGKTYNIGECNRYHPMESIKVITRAFKIMIIEKPDVIITTGSLPLALICLTAKILHKKVIWIDSIANTEKFSLSGRMVYHFADLFITQWPELAMNKKKAEYVGTLL